MLKINKTLKTLFVSAVLILSSNVFLFADGYYVGKGLQGKRLAVYEPTFKNVSASDQAALTDLVSIIRMDLHDYTGFTIVDAQNLDKIKKLQSDSESYSYTSESQLRADKMKFAEYEAFITVSKNVNSYSLTVSVTDLTSGEVKGEHIVKNISKITDVSESGVNKLLLNLVPKLGVQISAMGKYALSGGDTSDLSIAEQTKYAEQEEAALQSTLDDLDRRLKAFSSSSDMLDQNSVAAKAQLEAERQMTLQRLEVAKQKAQRLAQQREKEEKDKLAAAERSQNANAKINKLSNEVELVASQIRSKEFSTLTFMEQISIIEKEKKAYIELKDKIAREKKQLYADVEEEYNLRKVDVYDARNYRKAELSDGRPTAEAMKLKADQNQQLYNTLKTQADANAEKLDSTKQLNEIMQDIQAKEKALAKKQTINSLAVDNLLIVGDYNGSNKSWKADVNIIIDGIVYVRDSINIEFNALSTVIDGVRYSDADLRGANGERYNDYLDSVDAYESLFRMGTPIVYLEADFSVSALGKDNPSTYSLQASEYRLYSTSNKKLIAKYKPSQDGYIITLVPSYDLRNEKEYYNYTKKVETKTRKENTKIEARTMRKTDFTIYGSYLNGSTETGGNFGIAIDVGTGLNSYVVTQLEASFLGDNKVLNGMYGFGMNVFLPIGNYPCIYGDIAAGVSMVDGSLCFTAEADGGLEIPFGKLIINGQYGINYNFLKGFTDKYTVGLVLPINR